MLKIRIKGPEINLQIAGKKHCLKVIGKTSDNKKIAVDETLVHNESLMFLLNGYLIPPNNYTSQIETVLVKTSSSPEEDPSLILERLILKELFEVKNLPKVLAEGEIEISHWIKNHLYEIDYVRRDSPYFVMPIAPGQNLEHHALDWKKGTPKKEEVATLLTVVFPSLAETLAKVHKKGVVHRDIKPENILFDAPSQTLTLLDFSRSNWIWAKPRSEYGTYIFCPPEVILEKQVNEDFRHDVYSFGVTCFTTLTGERSILFGNMEDPCRYRGLDFLLISPEKIAKRYYRAILSHETLNLKELVQKSNFPPILKQEEKLSKYLVQLFHPDINQRPTDMEKIAQDFKRLGGKFLQHELWSANEKNSNNSQNETVPTK